jgi:hypothetical protein
MTDDRSEKSRISLVIPKAAGIVGVMFYTTRMGIMSLLPLSSCKLYYVPSFVIYFRAVFISFRSMDLESSHVVVLLFFVLLFCGLHCSLPAHHHHHRLGSSTQLTNADLSLRNPKRTSPAFSERSTRRHAELLILYYSSISNQKAL